MKLSNLLGIRNIRVAHFAETDRANQFLKEHNTRIIDVQNCSGDIMVVYQLTAEELEKEQQEQEEQK